MSTSLRNACSVTNACKSMAVINCEGCSQSFCTKHYINHRGSLGEEMSSIISQHNVIQQAFHEQFTETDLHPFVKEIDKWEEESIEKIKKRSEELRLELSQMTKLYRSQLMAKIKQIALQLIDSHQSDDYIETDLERWRVTIDDIRDSVFSNSTYSLEQQNDSTLIKNINLRFTIDNESFEQVFDNVVEIQHSGQIAVHDSSFNYTEIRGKNRYESGYHRIRLRIEQSLNSWTFLGVNSTSVLLQKKSFASKSSYGWTNNNYYWLNGECHPNRTESRIQMQSNDIVTLIFDCDNRKISMINERTNDKYELRVNIENCPLPWQLHVNLYEANSRVRILSV